MGDAGHVLERTMRRKRRKREEDKGEKKKELRSLKSNEKERTFLEQKIIIKKWH